MTAAKLVLSAAMIAWMASVVRKEDLAAAAGRISWAWVAAAALLMAWEAWAQAAKHRAILLASGPAPSVGRLVLLNLRIGAISQFLPGEIFGAGARLALMRGHVSLERCLSMMVFDRFTQLAATFAFGIFACLWVPRGRPLLPAAVVGFLILMAVPALATQSGIPGWLLRRMRLLPSTWGRRLRDFGGNLLSHLREHFASGTGKAKVFGLAAALQMQRALMLWTLCFAVGIGTGLPIVILYLTALILVQHAALSFGGLGVREATTVGFFGLFGTAPERALLLGLLVSTLQLARAGLGALLLIGNGTAALRRQAGDGDRSPRPGDDSRDAQGPNAVPGAGPFRGRAEGTGMPLNDGPELKTGSGSAAA